MLNPKIAEQRLKEFSVDGAIELQKARVQTLPESRRAHAFALLKCGPDGMPFFPGNDIARQYDWQKHWKMHQEAQEAAYKHLNTLSLAELETFFAVFFSRLASVLAVWWKAEGRTLYQNSYNRRPFRMDNGGLSPESRQERQSILTTLIGNMSVYQEMPIEWFAAWTPYLGPYNANMFGKLFAFAIDQGNEAVFQTLLDSAKGDHEIGAMGRHVTRGLLSASREEGWEWMEKTLLAAQRQEGLRQSILEVIDEANPTAFRRMLKLIRENDLFRFSATVRAADTWFGMNWVAYEKLSVKQANAATETVETFLMDPIGRDEVLASTTDGQTVYLALWSIAFDDAQAALKAAIPLLADLQVERRYAALHLLTELRLAEAQPAILSAFDDSDLRIAQKAFAACNWHDAAGAIGSVNAAHLALLTGQDIALTNFLEQTPGPGTPAFDFLEGLKNAVNNTIAIFTGGSENISQEKIIEVTDDRFERLERNIPRFPERAKQLEPVIWEWDTLTAHAETLADRLPNLLRKRPIERLFPFVARMSSYGRSTIADTIAKRTDKTPEMRELLFDLFADTQSYVRSAALKAIDKFVITEPESERIEGLLKRKSPDLRKASLTLLLKREDENVLASGERLTGSRDGNQRVAGLDLLTQMVEKKRQPSRAKAIVNAFVAERADKLTPAEKAMTELLTEEAHEQVTLENALGLLDRAKLTVGKAPQMPNPEPDSVGQASWKILLALDELIHQHREAEVKSAYSDQETYILAERPYWFPTPQMNLSVEEDLERLPLQAIWTDFWKNRSEELRDPDGRELIRAKITLGQANEKKYNHPSILQRLLLWFDRVQPVTDPVADAEFYLQISESLIAHIPEEKRHTEAHRDGIGKGINWRHALLITRWENWIPLTRAYVVRYGDRLSQNQIERFWNLVRYLDRPYPEAVTMPPAWEEVLLAFRRGVVTEAEVYEALLGPRHGRTSHHSGFSEMQSVSGRKNPLFETTAGLQEIVENCRRRILEVELRRGDTETVVSNAALALRYTGGADILFQTVAALGKETFARGYSYYGQTNRSNVFSKIIRATFPGESDTLEMFAETARTAKITDKRLVEIAVYAPQWAKHVMHTLGWTGLSDGVWWFHAHTKGSDWNTNTEMKEVWSAEIGDKTPLSPADLTEGAVDVAWFNRVYQILGEERWEILSEAAKYASSAGGHKRAQLFADALRGRISRTELLAKITEKRNQDSLRAIGLLPFANDAEDKEADLLIRYKAMQEFLRISKQFGAQRQESEKLATRIGMENLARTAGYPDPIRLTWAMEAASVADLKDGAVTVTVGETRVSLFINDLGMPEITIVKNGKSLANIPPAIKKDADVATLVARKTDITRQVARMRESLESAMCRGDKFTGKELAELLEHPVLRPLLRNLVFIEEGGREPVAGYPLNKALTAPDDQSYSITPETTLRIAHPYDLLHTGKWDLWQKDCFLRERVQPFKQVFRELYVVTDAETSDGTKSQRYTGHQVNPKQALALFHKRGWAGGGEYDYDSEGPRKTFHEDGYTVSVNFMGYTATPADVEGSTLEEVRFTKKGEWKSVELASVPPRVFSEAMRDLDLVVSVAHVGGVDPEASQSTTEMRTALLREMLDLLKIENVRLEKSHALIDGKLATYSVHLGSAVVHRQPGGYLCIVPVHSQHRGQLFLPFVDNDPRTAEVVSKVLILAKDNEIKDPTILEQILTVR